MCSLSPDAGREPGTFTPPAFPPVTFPLPPSPSHTHLWSLHLLNSPHPTRPPTAPLGVSLLHKNCSGACVCSRRHHVHLYSGTLQECRHENTGEQDRWTCDRHSLSDILPTIPSVPVLSITDIGDSQRPPPFCDHVSRRTAP